MNNNILRNLLAGYAHASWSGWMQYLFTKGHMNADGTFTINREDVTRWQRQMTTDYVRLSNSEQELDRTEADKIILLLRLFVGE